MADLGTVVSKVTRVTTAWIQDVNDFVYRNIGTGSATQGAVLVGWLRGLPSSVSTTLYKLFNWKSTNAFEFFSAAEVADVTSYTGAVDVTNMLEIALENSSEGKRDVELTAGVYKVTSVTIPGDPAVTADVNSARRIYGQGFGNPFSRVLLGGTIVKSTDDVPVFQDIAGGPAQANGTTEIDHIRFEGNSTSNVVLLRSALYGVSSFHHNLVYQESTGSGLSVTYGATSSIRNSYLLNRDWATSGLGAARVGTGLQFAQAYDAGLVTVDKVTSRGWLNGYVFNGAATLYNGRLSNSESSLCRNGIVLGDTEGFIADGNYLEGVDGGTAISDSGQASLIIGNLSFDGYVTGIDASAPSTYGGAYLYNKLNNGSVPNSISIRVGSSGAGGGPGKTVTGNHIGFSGSGGSVAGVVGLQLEGIDPRIFWYGNSFEPRGKWIGGAGTKKINDISTSSDGTTGTGIYGLGITESLDGSIECPHLGRGSVNLKLDPTALNNTNMSGTVLTVGQLSRFKLTPTSAIASITAVAAPNLPDKSFSIRVTPTAFSVTFTHGALMKLAGSTNLVVAGGSNGATITFDVEPGGICWERSRTVY